MKDLLVDEIPKRMEIWIADLPLKEGSSIQGGKRPVLIISNNICNEKNSIITVIPMTHQFKRLTLPTHAIIESPDGGESLVLVEQIMTIDKRLLQGCLGKVTRQDRRIIEAAIREQLGITKTQEVRNANNMRTGFKRTS